MNWMTGIRTSALAISYGFAAAATPAQTEPASGAESASKIAAINMRTAIASTAEGKQAATQLETEFQGRRKELEDLNKKISDLQQRLSAGANTLKDEEKTRLTSEGQRLTRELDRRQTDFQEDLNEAQNEVINRIGRKVVEVLGKYAPANGYSAVLDNSSQTTPVMYAATDITQQIVKLYDQSYPVKAAAAATGKPSGK